MYTHHLLCSIIHLFSDILLKGDGEQWCAQTIGKDQTVWYKKYFILPVNKFPSHKAFLGELFCSMLKVKPLKYYIIGSSIHKMVLRKRGVIPWLMRDQHIFALYYNFGIYDRHIKIVEFAKLVMIFTKITHTQIIREQYIQLKCTMMKNILLRTT